MKFQKGKNNTETEHQQCHGTKVPCGILKK